MFPVIVPDDVPIGIRLRCEKVPPGTALVGFLAGPLVMAEVHWSGTASKPCRWAMTAGALPCECRMQPVPTRKIGYLPIWSKYKEYVVVILSNQVAKGTLCVAHGTALKIQRTTVPKSPLLISTATGEEYPHFMLATAAQRKPIDIQPWLLHLWNCEILSRYYKDLSDTSVKKEIPKAPLIARKPTSASAPGARAPGANGKHGKHGARRKK